MANQANIVQNGIAGPVYLVDANGNPISVSNPLGVNASFSASSISINDPTTTTNKATVDGSGNLHVAIAGPLAAGTNVIGHVIVDSAGNVSITSLPSLPAGSNVIGHVVVDSGAVTNTQPDTTGSGTITAAQPSIGTPVSNATVTLAVGTGQSSWGAVLSGTFSAGSTIVVDHSRDGGTTWVASSFKVSGSLQNTTVQSVAGGATTEINGNDAGVSHIRIRCSVLAGGDSINVAIRAGYGIGGVGLLSSIPAGNNLIGGVNLVDSAGTNKAAIDAAGNLAIKGGFAEQASLSAGSLNADLVASVDVSAYKSLAIQVNGTFVGTLTFQWSNDNSNWVSLSTFYGSANTQPVSSTTGTGLWISSVVARYLRIRMTAYTSGTATGVLELYTHSANAYPSVNALAAQSGTWASQLLDSGGANKASIDSGGNLHALTPDTSTSGTVTNDNDAVTIALPGGQATALMQITTSNLNGTLLFEGSPDSGTTWYSSLANQIGTSTIATSIAGTGGSQAAGAWRANVAGFTNFRVRLHPTTSGTAAIIIRQSAGVHNVTINNATVLGQNTKANSASVTIASDQSSYSSPLTTETSIISAIRAGKGFVATTGSKTSAGTLVDALSLFNTHNSGKTLILYRVQAQYGTTAGSHPVLTATYQTSDPGPGWTSTVQVTPQNASLGGAASVASVYQTAVASGASIAGTTLFTYDLGSSAPQDILAPSQVFVLNDTTGFTLYINTVNTTTYALNFFWIEI